MLNLYWSSTRSSTSQLLFDVLKFQVIFFVACITFWQTQNKAKVTQRPSICLCLVITHTPDSIATLLNRLDRDDSNLDLITLPRRSVIHHRRIFKFSFRTGVEHKFTVTNTSKRMTHSMSSQRWQRKTRPLNQRLAVDQSCYKTVVQWIDANDQAELLVSPILPPDLYPSVGLKIIMWPISHPLSIWRVVHDHLSCMYARLHCITSYSLLVS